MYINPNQYAKTFQDIKRSSLSHSTCKLVIFVSCLDVDALCAAKILSLLLRKELIQYQLIPTTGYSDLKSHYDKLDNEVTNIILIGCGAMLDLEGFFDVNPEEFLGHNSTTNGHTIDNANEAEIELDVVKTDNFALTRKIYVVDGHRPWNLDNLFGSAMVVCLDNGYVDGNLNNEKESYNVLVEMSDSEDEDEDEDEDEERNGNNNGDDQDGDKTDVDDENDEPRASTSRRGVKSIHEDKIQTYYNQSSTITSSCSITVYALVSAIGETNVDNLWLGIVGASGFDCSIFVDEVRRFSNDSGIHMERGTYLPLLRHSSLYDALLYNWIDGDKRIHKILAKMGVPIVAAKQQWQYLDPPIKNKLPGLLKKYLPELPQVEIFYRCGVTSMDVFVSLTALLETGVGLNSNNNNNNGVDHGDLEDENEIIRREIKSRESSYIRNFWSAFDSVSSFGIANNIGLEKGITAAKLVQKELFQTIKYIIEQKLIKNLKVYRLCILKDESSHSGFDNPVLLIKLSNRIMDYLKQQTSKPLVVAAELSNTYFVLGIGINNAFSKISGAQMKKDFFEVSLVEIKKEDLAPFLEQLTFNL
ncbi:DNA replication initiation factor, putative [Candida dubliniensis CD36]|uniref:Cell division control protein 45 homologue, putative n=1 Tax=Candida dubliniensis (strain CD36 / ATCC MYA-646 / CBS 7987 / NCPF 3949 / NRRL Y-17841) TaxID=573826 RepID=B9WMH0_CANDC|nr:DNA replication initiation factor, putative [Candida dubliniensis CD36]CAX40283.1 DNA replication initiation factor, putative [Candida dubliniensis CD36]